MLPSSDVDDKRRRRRPRIRVRRAIACVGLLTIIVALFLWRQRILTSEEGPRYDVVIVPGGGLDASHQPAAWVVERLDAALAHDAETRQYLVLSRGTTHKPPPLGTDGFPIDEAAASAKYLVAHGVAPSRILLESWSLDTIGNAAFARLMHADLRGWRRMLVVTSAFHRPRTEAIFQGSHSARTRHCICALFSLWHVHCVWYRPSSTGSLDSLTRAGERGDQPRSSRTRRCPSEASTPNRPQPAGKRRHRRYRRCGRARLPLSPTWARCTTFSL